MYRKLKQIIICSLFPFMAFSQGMNIELLETANGAGFIPYTDIDGYQGYTLLADLLATLGTGGAANADSLGGLAPSYYLNFANLINTPNITNQIFGVSNITGSGIGVDTSGAALELSEFGGKVEYKGKANENIYIRSEQNKIYFGLLQGTGSELDADRLDAQSGAYYLDWGNLTNVPTGFLDGVDNVLSTEQVQDAIGGMVAGNTEAGITVIYDDAANEFDFTVAPIEWISILNKPSSFTSNWSTLGDIPAGFADGTDNNTTYTASNGIQLVGSQFQLHIDGLSTESSPVLGDYIPLFDVSQNTENKMTLTALSNLIGGSDGNNYPTSFTTINSSNILTLNRSGLSPITTDLSSLKANWNLIFNMPSGFSDGVDNNNTYSAGNGITLNGSQMQLAINLLSTESSPVLGDYIPLFDVSQNTENKMTLTALSNLIGGSNGNNYPTSLSVSGTTTKIITIGRNGLPNLTASFSDLSGTGTTPNIFSNHVITANYSGGTKFTGTTVSPDNTSDNITYSNQDPYIQVYGNATSDAIWWGLNEANVREYINPDEELTEKSTNQFNYLNQLIYKRTFNFGSVSANTTETQSLSINSLENLITRVRDVGSTNQHIGGSQVDLTTETGEIEVWAANGSIHVKNTSTSVGVNSVIVTVYYTK